jgi:uncharacterized protein YacL
MRTLTIIHTLISLVGIATGFVVVFAMLKGKHLDRWTAWFLGTTVATSVTGYFFPFVKLLPSHVVGAISLVILAFTLFALYRRHLSGPWRSIYVGTAVAALYFNVFVLVVQLFLKVPALKALAPTQSEPPFAIAQSVVFVIFAVLGVLAVKKFRQKEGLRALAVAASK